MSDRLLIIGWDGATFDVIQPMIARGELPHLAQLLTEGAHGLLRSTVPPSSAVAWPTFMTGRDPSGHGVFGFYQTGGYSYRPHLVSSRDIEAPCLWDWLGWAGYRTGVINVPITYPPRPLRGFLVSGMLTPGPGETFTYPRDLTAQLLTGPHPYPLEAQMMKQLRKGWSSATLLNVLHNWTADFHAAVRELISGQPWDCFIAVYRTTDIVQHLLGFLLHADLGDHFAELAAQVNGGIEAIYRQVDECLGELLSRIPPETTVVVLSDHGVGPTSGRFYLNNWLHQHGYLALKRGIRYRRWLNSARRVPLHRGLNRLGLGVLTRLLPAQLTDWSIGLPDRHHIYHLIDWYHTRAYMPFSGNRHVIIRLNLIGREPEGIVQLGAGAEELLSQLAHCLDTLRDPQGRLLFQEVAVTAHNSTDLITNRGPDLVSLPREDNHYAVLPSIIADGQIFADPLPQLVGQHRIHGILVARGPAIAPGVTLKSAHLVDIAPTALHLMGLPVPTEMDGHVLVDALQREWLATHPVRIAAEDLSAWRSGQLDVYSSEESIEIRDGLRALGYLE